MPTARPLFYDELAHWWSLFSPPEHYVEEALDLLPRLGPLPAGRPATLLELGAGGGSLAFHLKPHFQLTLTGGTVAVLPDYVRETFVPGTDEGGEDGSDGRGFRYLEWCWDPDPADHTYLVDYAFLMRDADGTVQVAHDRHVEGLFPRASWLEWFREAGLPAASSLDPWGRDVFIARPT